MIAVTVSMPVPVTVIVTVTACGGPAVYIRRPAGFSALQVAIVTVIGTIGGYYIWRPAFQKYPPTSPEQSPSNSPAAPAAD